MGASLALLKRGRWCEEREGAHHPLLSTLCNYSIGGQPFLSGDKTNRCMSFAREHADSRELLLEWHRATEKKKSRPPLRAKCQYCGWHGLCVFLDPTVQYRAQDSTAQ